MYRKHDNFVFFSSKVQARSRRSAVSKIQASRLAFQLLISLTPSNPGLSTMTWLLLGKPRRWEILDLRLPTLATY
jgi:hypothetical protein